MRSVRAWLGAVVALLVSYPVEAQGHGPVYGLSTPTLGRHDWSLDVALMGRFLDGSRGVMLRSMLSYGITEDVQASVSLPMSLYTPAGLAPVRGPSRMPVTRDVELLAGWRFDREATNVGARRESTIWLGLTYPTDSVRAAVRTAPGLYGALVTGYASRSVYAWAGALYRRYMTPNGPAADHPGDAALLTLVLGYRPPAFRHDYPRPDWRIFLELVGEDTQRDVIAGIEQRDTGGRQVYAGLTLLGLYGPWGVSGGPALPVYRRLDGSQRGDQVRFVVNTAFWF